MDGWMDGWRGTGPAFGESGPWGKEEEEVEEEMDVEEMWHPLTVKAFAFARLVVADTL